MIIRPLSSSRSMLLISDKPIFNLLVSESASNLYSIVKLLEIVSIFNIMFEYSDLDPIVKLDIEIDKF